MRINIKGKNKFEVTEALKQYIVTKVERLSDLFEKPEDITANVLCKVYDKHHTVEITIPTKHLVLRAESDSEDMYAATDLATDKIERQLIKHKKKVNALIRRREGISSYFSQKVNDSNEVDVDKKIVKNKELKLEKMSKEDAITQMEMLGHDFFVFLDESNFKVTVLYLRNDGNYATIEAK